MTSTLSRKRKYEPLKDARRFCDGVRLHEYVGAVLVSGWESLKAQRPEAKLSPMEFSRVAIPLLSELSLIVLVDPKSDIPEWLDERSRKLARRGNMLPIWMPAPSLSFGVWKNVTMHVQHGGELRLQPSEGLKEKRRLN